MNLPPDLPAADRPAIVDLEAVSKTYPGRDGQPVVALAQTTLGVASGEVVCVAGRSGSGKTTLLLIAAGLLAPSAGAVRWSGEDLDGLGMDGITSRRARLMGFAFQQPSLLDTLTVEENVGIGGAVVRVADGRTRARTLIRAFGLDGLGRRFPRELSGGEQQRVALARALFTEAPIVVADEPTASLDRAAAVVVIDVLRGAAGAGKGILLASHDPAVIEAADRVFRLER